MKEGFFSKKNHPRVPGSGRLAPDLEKIKAAICKEYGVSESERVKSRRGFHNEPRNAAIYPARQLRRDGLLDIGLEFSSRTGSSVSSAHIKA